MFETLLNRSLKLSSYFKYVLRDKVNFNDLMNAFQSQINYILVLLEEMIYTFDIDKATGAKLDLIGEYVGQPRITTEYSNKNFSFDSKEYGFDNGLFDAGGKKIDDTQYRILIRSKIFKNNTKNWDRNSLLAYHKMLLGENYNIEIIENTLNVTVKIHDSLEPFLYQVLNEYKINLAGIKIQYEVNLNGN